MFQFLYIFGPAAITFLAVRKLSEKPAPDLVTGIAEFIAYAVLDAALTTLLLYPFGRVELVFNSQDIRDIRYGITAFFLSLILAVIVGIAITAIDKRTEIQLQITKVDAGQSDEKESVAKKNIAKVNPAENSKEDT